MHRISTWTVVMVSLSWAVAEDLLTSVPIGSNTADFYPTLTKTQQSLPSNGKGRHFEIAIPEEEQTQYLTQDNQGRYTYGYAIPDQVRTETRSGNGIVDGSYSYTDPDGKENKVHYRADASGFRVVANNIAQVEPAQPVAYSPEEEAEREQHFKTWRAIADSHRDFLTQGKAGAHVIRRRSEADSMDPILAVESVINPVESPLVSDVENQAVVITGGGSVDENDDDDDIRIDAEPIRLLAQLYAKHFNNAEIPEIIARPHGFRPSNLAKINPKFDLFQRAYQDTVEVINPEYVDLRAFLLTNRFRNQESRESYENPIKNLQELHNYYFGLPAGTPLVLTREGWVAIPQSLKYLTYGTTSIDGKHDAQVSPFQQHEYADEQFRQYLY